MKVKIAIGKSFATISKYEIYIFYIITQVIHGF